VSVELLRVDDRLVHGQVVEGWLKALRINHIVVASDAVEADETQKALYMLAVPHGVKLSCMSVVAAAQAWKTGIWKDDKVLILIATPQDVLRMLQNGAPIKSVNVGGMHFREGRVQVLKAVSLDEQDVAVLQELAQARVILEARPLPLDEPINVAACLERWRTERPPFGEPSR
jgi:mannose/fructose/N-acetylgalactosamine-specific phosphotransferase system component IIB